MKVKEYCLKKKFIFSTFDIESAKFLNSIQSFSKLLLAIIFLILSIQFYFLINQFSFQQD